MTVKHLINFESLKQELTQFENCDYDKKRDRLDLTFTLFGDYVGNTVNKSNYAVFKQELESISIHDRSEGIKEIEASYSTCYFAIVSDITPVEYQLIKDCLESVADYPLLDDEHTRNKRTMIVLSLGIAGNTRMFVVS
jgi:hypothetical protein